MSSVVGHWSLVNSCALGGTRPRLSPCRHKARSGHHLAVLRTRKTTLRRPSSSRTRSSFRARAHTYFVRVRSEGLARDSRLVATRLGLGTTSRFCVLAKQRSGVRVPHAREAVFVLERTLTSFVCARRDSDPQ